MYQHFYLQPYTVNLGSDAASHDLSTSLSAWASGTTALTLYRPLKVHGSFASLSQWLQEKKLYSWSFSSCSCGAITKNRWYPSSKNQDTRIWETSDDGARVNLYSAGCCKSASTTSSFIIIGSDRGSKLSSVPSASTNPWIKSRKASSVASSKPLA